MNSAISVEERQRPMRENFTAWQLRALAHPWESDPDPAPACIHRLTGDRSVILTCDVDDETIESFGGPVWHVSVWPPVRAHAEALLAKVGEGVLFDEPGVNPNIYHLRKRMTAAEIERLGG
jgi:hypothetical protein